MDERRRMMERYLVECDTKPCCEFGTANFTFKNAQVVKLRPDQKVVWTRELEAREYQAKRDGRKEGLKDGQNEAWELARKIVSSPNNGGYTCPELKDIFGTGLAGNCFRDNTYQEAADKERKWKETANIRVGDVLVSTGNLKALVTYIGDNYMCLLFSDGSCGQIVKDDIKEFYKKTGQQFDVTTVIDLLKEEE
jgi:hypothetical protein